MVSPFDIARKHPPRVVVVLGHKIKIRTVEYLEDEGTDLLGAFNAETLTIFLLKCPQWRSVLFHEITHCALYLSGASEGLSNSREEAIVLALEHALYPLIGGDRGI